MSSVYYDKLNFQQVGDKVLYIVNMGHKSILKMEPIVKWYERVSRISAWPCL